MQVLHYRFKFTCTVLSLFFLLATTMVTANANAAGALTGSSSGKQASKVCNPGEAAAVLASRLHLDQDMKEGVTSNASDLIDLVCKTHPLHTENTIVALLYELHDDKGRTDDEAKGFIMAVINIDKNQVLQLYRDKIDADASTRFDRGVLELDTARYMLAPGVRALGVRMHIGYSPKCSEGGSSDYLTLFVEEGKKLRPVLKDMAMSTWRLADGPVLCSRSDKPSVIDSVERSIVVLPGMTGGWHDLQVVAHHSIETINGSSTDGDNVKPLKTSRIEGTLQMRGQQYPIVY